MYYAVVTKELSKVVSSWKSVLKVKEKSEGNVTFRKLDSYELASEWLLDNGYSHLKGLKDPLLDSTIEFCIDESNKIALISLDEFILVRRIFNDSEKIDGFIKALELAEEHGITQLITNAKFLANVAANYAFIWKLNGWRKKGDKPIHNLEDMKRIHYSYCKCGVDISIDETLNIDAKILPHPIPTKWQVIQSSPLTKILLSVSLSATGRLNKKAQFHKVCRIECYGSHSNDQIFSFSYNLLNVRKEFDHGIFAISPDAFVEILSTFIQNNSFLPTELQVNDIDMFNMLLSNQLNSRANIKFLSSIPLKQTAM
ncbi:hypothetical protein [Vibrio harveyi]|uniref:hypothetical protein n=2 Tax=Vibrio harveyi TaxID=669 RepID=UPI003D722D08